MKEAYERGDVVWWWSEQTGPINRSKAMFVKYDEFYPEFKSAILAIKVGNLKQQFRWPLKLMKKVEQ